MRKILLCCIFSLSFCLAAAEQAAALFSFHGIFTSNMVLQRDMPIRISGSGTPEAYVNVQLGGHRRKAVIDKSGTWEAVFPALPAGGPYTLLLSGATHARNIILDNILIGEVWLCSGQSNMAMPVFSKDPFWRAANALEERNNARFPKIRLFTMPPAYSSLEPLSSTGQASWQICTPDNVGSFSALAYFYGRELHRRLNVPVGLIHASWSGTPIESWLPYPVLQEHPAEFAGELKALRHLRELQRKIPEEKELEKQQQEWFRQFDSHDPAAVRAAAAWKNFQYKDDSWEKITPPWKFPEQYCGVVWFRNTFSLPGDFIGCGLELHLGEIRDSDRTYINGKKIGSTDWLPQRRETAERVYRIPAGTAMRGRNSLAIRIVNYEKNGGLLRKARDFYIRRTDNGKIFYLADNWKMKPEYYIPAGRLGKIPVLAKDQFNRLNTPWMTTALFNGMIAPWRKFPMRGVIWYQGCANAGQKRYYDRHRQLIESWRQSLNQPDMPFLLVQLSGFAAHRPKDRLPDDFWKSQPPQNDVPWALTREIQSELTSMTNVGMAVSLDRGDHSDIHPRDKQTVAARLACEAERIAYHRKNSPRSPVCNGMRIENDKIRIYFKYAEPRLKTSDGKAPGCFAIAGKDGKFVWAQAQIIGSTVLVYSPDVPKPTAVRYGWVTYRGDVNLCNEQNMPAVPFRTDKPEYPSLP